ncbi:MAG TPA: hypothetical protein VGJ38_01495 [Jatrophihabitantaceae bacterium]|jgi:hypothetical protein
MSTDMTASSKPARTRDTASGGIPLGLTDGDLVRAANLAKFGRHEDSGVTWQR